MCEVFLKDKCRISDIRERCGVTEGRVAVILISIATLVLGIILSFVPWLDYIILRDLRLWNGSISYSYWQKPGVTRYTKVYIFNVTNPNEFLEKGEKPKLVEVGPFVYTLRRRVLESALPVLTKRISRPSLTPVYFLYCLCFSRDVVVCHRIRVFLYLVILRSRYAVAFHTKFKLTEQASSTGEREREGEKKTARLNSLYLAVKCTNESVRGLNQVEVPTFTSMRGAWTFESSRCRRGEDEVPHGRLSVFLRHGFHWRLRWRQGCSAEFFVGTKTAASARSWLCLTEDTPVGDLPRCCVVNFFMVVGKLYVKDMKNLERDGIDGLIIPSLSSDRSDETDAHINCACGAARYQTARPQRICGARGRAYVTRDETHHQNYDSVFKRYENYITAFGKKWAQAAAARPARN
ncbi:Lysosome membrane protein 2 [Eumeta japonica]|uniref:Lysosome membrane protein 2 n=1 Tax=Eumeta variegata TaxID=151549 RepID=A0A4C1U204_EUMVA|nr:Lysosome membrane protein 2 [Eumeta japonica]